MVLNNTVCKKLAETKMSSFRGKTRFKDVVPAEAEIGQRNHAQILLALGNKTRADNKFS